MKHLKQYSVQAKTVYLRAVNNFVLVATLVLLNMLL